MRKRQENWARSPAGAERCSLCSQEEGFWQRRTHCLRQKLFRMMRWRRSHHTCCRGVTLGAPPASCRCVGFYFERGVGILPTAERRDQSHVGQNRTRPRKFSVKEEEQNPEQMLQQPRRDIIAAKNQKRSLQLYRKRAQGSEELGRINTPQLKPRKTDKIFIPPLQRPLLLQWQNDISQVSLLLGSNVPAGSRYAQNAHFLPPNFSTSLNFSDSGATQEKPVQEFASVSIG